MSLALPPVASVGTLTRGTDMATRIPDRHTHTHGGKLCNRPSYRTMRLAGVTATADTTKGKGK